MSKPHNRRSVAPSPEVEDPHPGSISDGTHPSAIENKQPTPTDPYTSDTSITVVDEKLDLKEGRIRVNTEAPKHPNKAACGS
ncbi:hypothetical protein [Shinella zoogloeoides]